MRMGPPGWVYIPGPSANCPLLLASLFALLQVSTTTADSETSFNMQTSEPGPHPEGDTVQTVHIKSCLLEDATIGNGNKMTIHLRSKGGVMESGDSEEPKEDTGEPGSPVCAPTSFLHPGFKHQGSGLVQGHKGLELSGWTKSQHIAPGCREDLGIDTKVIKSHRGASSRTEGSRDFLDLQ